MYSKLVTTFKYTGTYIPWSHNFELKSSRAKMKISENGPVTKEGGGGYEMFIGAQFSISVHVLIVNPCYGPGNSNSRFNGKFYHKKNV